jgi:hypothetical protein
MTPLAHLIVEYQQQIYIGLGLLALICAALLVRANARLARTPFGLEREDAYKRRNRALAMLTLLVLLAVIIFLSNSIIIPALAARQATATPPQSPTASPSPVSSSQDIVVDSSGCENPDATLTAPASGERIAAAFEVHGTANIANFAFYKFEISGTGTGGAWLSLGVGTEPVVAGKLGSFDASAREPGNYAFRLVVVDSAGNYPPPCIVTVTIVQASSP